MTPQPNGGTPRTDKLIDILLSGEGIPVCPEWDSLAAFARELERELADALATITSMRAEHEAYRIVKARAGEAESALSDLRAENARLRKDAEMLDAIDNGLVILTIANKWFNARWHKHNPLEGRNWHGSNSIRDAIDAALSARD